MYATVIFSATSVWNLYREHHVSSHCQLPTLEPEADPRPPTHNFPKTVDRKEIDKFAAGFAKVLAIQN